MTISGEYLLSGLDLQHALYNLFNYLIPFNMKKILLTTAMICLAVFTSGQTKGFKTENQVLKKLEKLSVAQEALNVSEKLDSIFNESWNEGSSTWVAFSKKKYTYLVVGNTTTMTILNKDASTGNSWVNSSKTVTTVNTGGLTTLQITYNWNIAGSKWVESMKMEFTYDGSSNMTTEKTYSWNQGLLSWFGISRTDYFFTANVLTYDIGYTWDLSIPTPDWTKSTKAEYTYSSGILTKVDDYDWDNTLATPDWVKSGKTELTYSGGKLTKEEEYKWDNTIAIPAYVKYYKFEYTYDANGRITLMLGYDWDLTLTVPDWVSSDKTESTYDLNGRTTKYSSYFWDKTLSRWEGFQNIETTYGVIDNVNYSQSLSYRWETSIPAWVKNFRATYYYSGLNTSVSQPLSEKGITVYPNPASNHITFTGTSGAETVELINMSGSKVLEQKLSDDGVLQVGHLSKGVYIYRVYGHGITRTGRVVLK
jgi:hypothetical protein